MSKSNECLNKKSIQVVGKNLLHCTRTQPQSETYSSLHLVSFLYSALKNENILKYEICKTQGFFNNIRPTQVNFKFQGSTTVSGYGFISSLAQRHSESCTGSIHRKWIFDRHTVLMVLLICSSHAQTIVLKLRRMVHNGDYWSQCPFDGNDEVSQFRSRPLRAGGSGAVYF